MKSYETIIKNKRSKYYLFSLVALFWSSDVLASDGETLWDGKHYKQNSSVQQILAEQVLRGITFPKKTGFHVLDIGTGDGSVAKDLIIPLTGASKLTILEPSEDMLSICRETFEDKNNVSFIQGKIEDFEGSQTLFDCVTSFFAFHWVQPINRGKAFRNIAVPLRPGGLFVAVFCIGSDKPRLKTAVDQQMKSDKWAGDFKDLADPLIIGPKEIIQSLLEENNLKEQHHKVHESITPFEDDEALYSWISGWSQFKKILGDRDKEFWLETIHLYRKLTNQSTEMKSVNYIDYYLEIVAVKQ